VNEALQWHCGRCGSDFTDVEAGCSCGWAPRQRSGYLATTTTSFVPAGFSVDRRDHLRDLEQNHFWFEARDRLLSRILKRTRSQQASKAIDLGCGTGRFLSTLGGFAGTTVGVEGHDALASQAAARDSGAIVIAADVQSVPLASGQFDLISILDVLEHVDPLSLLREAGRLARPGARLLISVPAFAWLWSHTDEAAGHRCRYDLALLRSELEASGWTLDGHTYYQALLLPLVFASRWRRSDRTSGIERTPPAWLNRLLGACNALEVAAFSRFSLPFGSSLLGWAQRTE
jgi:SAM-dependent methyltransferase